MYPRYRGKQRTKEKKTVGGRDQRRLKKQIKTTFDPVDGKQRFNYDCRETLTRKGVCFVWKTGDTETCASVFKKDHSRRHLCGEFNVRLITWTLHETKATPLAGVF